MHAVVSKSRDSGVNAARRGGRTRGAPRDIRGGAARAEEEEAPAAGPAVVSIGKGFR